MLPRHKQAVYRPLVSLAWMKHCELTGCSPNNKPSYDAWYRDQLHSAIGKWSTRDADPDRDFQPLMDRFMLLAGEPQLILIRNWSIAQNEWFNKEARKSFDVERERGNIAPDVAFEAWIHAILDANSIDIDYHIAPDRTKAFDGVMAHLGTISGDERLISHFSEAMEIRARHAIRNYMEDLAWLETRVVTWDYVRAIWKQSEMLPALDEAPAATLIKVLQMLDSHVRRICREKHIRPKCLPTRCHDDRCHDTCCPMGGPTCKIGSSPQEGGNIRDDIPF